MHIPNPNDFNKYTPLIEFSPIISFVKTCGKRSVIKKGEYFTKQGEVCKTMGFVESGSFRYCCTSNSGIISIVGYTFEDSFVGNYPAFQLGDFSNVDIQAICNSTIYTVSRKQLNEFYESSDDNQKLGRQIAEILLWEVYDRMIGMYNRTPEERYLEILDRSPALLNMITLKELASFLMICPETLSRLRKKLATR